MISILDRNKVQIIKPTMFPDGTSQIWKLDLDQYKGRAVKLIWNFEQEAEVIWLKQAITLLNASSIEVEELFIPYLPYARQDKEVSNTTTFAKSIFLEMLMTNGVNKVTTLDSHSHSDGVESYCASPYIYKAIDEFKPDTLVFPDEGAFNRYASKLETLGRSVIVLDKVRNQETGLITSLKINKDLTSDSLIANVGSKPRMLIIDDICDGGATFINASLFLHEIYDCSIGLYVTHGIYSKGFENLIKSGISDFYTTQSLIKNVTAYTLENN